MSAAERSPIEGIEKIAVLRANAIGDFVFALPALEALRAAYPSAEIVLLAGGWHAEFLAGRPGPVDRVLVVPGGEHRHEACWTLASEEERGRFFAAARGERFDLAIQMHGGGGNSNPFVAQLGARLTAGLRTVEAAHLDRWVRYVYYQSELARCLEVVGLVGAAPVRVDPSLEVTDADRMRLAASLPWVPGWLEDGGEIAVIHPGASDARRRWPPERFGEVARALASSRRRVLVTGSGEEMSLAERVAAASRGAAASVAGQLDLRGLVALLAACRLVVSNDSGPLHLADAVGSPTVGIYWSVNLINGGPWRRGRHRPILSWTIGCPACGADWRSPRCPHDDSVVADVRVDEVLAAADDLLLTTAPAGNEWVGGTYPASPMR